MKFSLLVAAGADNPTSRQARIAEADAIRSMGAIDNQAVLEAHAWPHWPQVVARMQEEAQEAANQQAAHAGAAASQPHGPGTGHAH